MKFIADVMLGSLAKRMRLLGFDVTYERSLDDNEIIRQALEQDRIILTRDKSLAGRPLAAAHLFIMDDKVRNQIQQVLDSLPIHEPLILLTRCSECNEPLSPVPGNEARDRVPAYVYERYRYFLECPVCRRIYWKGSHTRRMSFSIESK